ncbi:hypothetical protein PRIPAC_82947 [Pristionchus pacificus]|uniref:Uncharacterized protein n=1 Tax=Pristionchus pacificus TaxID=54126 RepID=A0A2A6CNW6_PRIPA|nr:hypothetical protein PRIPAC_82947 [Pristionchus pacificus]|eukprot:PDM79796.1 hypothetical protein PRIPAC_32375 [Pristionchus pacificus]
MDQRTPSPPQDVDEKGTPTSSAVEENGLTNSGDMSKRRAGAKPVIVSSEREVSFLARVGLNSLEEVETMLRDTLEELDQFRQMLEHVKALEKVEDIPQLIEKMHSERVAFQRELSGWDAVREEFRQLASVVKLQENERFVDRWHSMNHELQLLTEKVNGMKVQAEVEEGRLLFYKNKVEQLEKQNAILVKEQKRIVEQQSQESNPGQMVMGQMRTYITPSAHSGSALLRTSDRVMGKSIGMMANALPEMAKYSGEKEDWNDFETGFMIRYGKMDTVIALSLLKDHLEGEAKDALRTIPFEEKNKGVESVLKWLRSRLSNETPFEELEVDKMLRHQTVDGKSVGNICEELEYLTAKLNVNDVLGMEDARRRQLLILYEGKQREHERLISLFEEKASYAKMKAALVELEYLRNTELRIHNGISTSWRYDNGMSNEWKTESFYGNTKTESFSGRGYMGAQSGPRGGVEMISRDSDQ